MSRTRYHFLPEDPVPYFITITTVDWMPLFEDPEVINIIVNSLQFLIEKQRISLIAYVIMVNHLHLIASADNLSKEVANFKSFTARSCINYYTSREQNKILDQLSERKLDHKRDRQHQFWQEGSHPQRIISKEMLQQKIDYIHANPFRKGYVDKPEDWLYSSARDYAGQTGLLPICFFV